MPQFNEAAPLLFWRCFLFVSCIYLIYNEEPESSDLEQDKVERQESDNSSMKKVSLIFCLLVTFSDNLIPNIHILTKSNLSLCCYRNSGFFY